VREVIGGLPPPTFYQRGLKPKDITFHPNHWTMNPRSPKFRNGMQGSGRSFKKLAWDKPSYTVAYGNREVHIHPEGKRLLSASVAMLYQQFPTKTCAVSFIETFSACFGLY
jgi:DNA (cytosine-5)-methyltransferase 1